MKKSSSAGSPPSATGIMSRARTRRGTGPKTGRIANGQVRPSAVKKAGTSAAPGRTVRIAAFMARKAVAVKRNSAAARETVRDSSIHRYHRSDVNFVVQVGTRIPNTIEFYDAPAQVVHIDPVFQSYKIVVLDDVILVIDPATREIVDVIRT